MEVRDVIFHPYRPLIFSSGDGKYNSSCKREREKRKLMMMIIDGFVKVYTYKSDATDVGMKDA